MDAAEGGAPDRATGRRRAIAAAGGSLRLAGVALGYGLLTWLIPFAVAMLLFQVRGTQRALFESIMAVVVTAVAVICAARYFRRVTSGYLRHGIGLGLLWLVMNVALDLPAFLWGPMAMTPPDYLMDIGLTYLIFPVVTIGDGVLLEWQQRPE